MYESQLEVIEAYFLFIRGNCGVAGGSSVQFTSFHFPQTALVAVTLTGSGYNLGHQKGLD